MTRRVSLILEALETRLTPATVKAVAVILPASQTNPVLSPKVAVQTVNPITVTGQSRLPVIQVPQPLIAFSEDRGNVWNKWIAPGLDLGQGVGAVVAFSANALNSDLVYLVVQQGERPTSFRAVISWADADIDREAPKNKRMIIHHHR